jgi:hypothetical protein
MRPTYQRLPTLDAWNVSVQRQITGSTSVTVAYVGNRATNMFAGNGPSYDANPPAYGAGNAIVATAGVAPGFAPLTPIDQRRPYWNAFTYPGVIDPNTGKTMKCCGGGIMGNYAGNDATGDYNALQVTVDRRFTQGLQFQAYYTYSHANNHSGDFGNYATAPWTTYGPDDFNRTHVFLWNAVYQLPFGKGKMFANSVGKAADLIIGGWQISNTLNISSGLPWTPSFGECGQTVDTGPCVPNRIGSFHVGAGSFDPNTHTVTYFTPVSALVFPAASLTPGVDTCTLPRPTAGGWQMPACGGIGNAGRNSMWGPHKVADDMSISKNFPITERYTLQFRTDAYNVFNHPVYGFSSQDYGATGGTCIDCGGNNGKITNIENGTTMRQLTFALKLQF